MQPAYDTIIIGAGMSGLAAGIRLALFDQRVCIVERHSKVGGLNSVYRRGGRNYDVGLHAVTNYAPRGAKRGPLALLLRQLRLDWRDLDLAPQVGSTIAFPGVSLQFSNDFALLESEVGRHFPSQKDAFRRLARQIMDYDQLGSAAGARSTREVVGSLIHEPLLLEMLLCPLLYFGSARENDTDFGQFSIMFRSIYLEGLARPRPGVRRILRSLLGKFKQLGGELRLGCAVRRIAAQGGAVHGVILDDGAELTARRFLSSAGWPETRQLCEDLGPLSGEPAGQLSFVETISILDAQPRNQGCDRTIVFYNDSPTFRYQKPEELVDVRSGVISTSNNFLYDEPLEEGVVRVTALANWDRWAALQPPAYGQAKRECRERILASAVRFVPDFRPAIVASDTFTPLTVHRFTGRRHGAVYGSPHKRYDGTTPLGNLFLCGTDQGLVGIVGAIISGITIANRHLLKG